MRLPSVRWSPGLGLLLRGALFGGVYAAFAWVSDTTFRYPVSPIAILWPPVGFTLAVLLRSRPRSWPVLLAFLFLGALVELSALGIPRPVAVGWSVAVVLEPLVGASLLRAALPTPPCR